jgi:hypothetical protein
MKGNREQEKEPKDESRVPEFPLGKDMEEETRIRKL